MKLKDYLFVTGDGESPDTVSLRDEAGKVHVFSISHSRFVRFSQDMAAFVLESTNRLDFLREEGRES
jgi:hypothetical protein